jgi:hypothetical protein
MTLGGARALLINELTLFDMIIRGFSLELVFFLLFVLWLIW